MRKISNMEILYPENLIPSLKNKHLLLDANVFRDSVNKPLLFATFFNKLKGSEVTLATIDAVKFELLKGSLNSEKFNKRENQIKDIVDVVLPLPTNTNSLIYKLIDDYKSDGSQLSITDLYLGAMLMQYKENLFLMSRDTTDFIQDIFELKFIINAPHKKGIFTYGVYQYL